MKKTHIFPFMIAYADTDAGGIAYHARYIEIAERARMDLFSGIDDPDGGFVIKKLSVEYKKPLRLGDRFNVETIFTGRTAATADVRQTFVKDGEVMAILTGTAVYVDALIRPKKLTPAWMEYIG